MSSWPKYIQILFVIQIVVLLILAQDQVHFSVIRQWNYVNYTWPSLQTATNNSEYIVENIVIAGVIYFEGWFYLTMPRMKPGVPATLGRISAIPEKITNPLINPFPSWKYNELGDCNALQNVQNVEIDLKRQMWIIDGGHTASLTNAPIRNCSPKLIIFDLSNNTTVATHIFSETVAAKNDSFLYDLVVDNEFAYITDNSRHDPGIIVYSRQSNHSWKIRHSESMQADPSAQYFAVNGISIKSPINIAGIAMTPNIQGSVVNEDKQVFYCPLSSLHLYSINTSILRNEDNSKKALHFSEEIKDVGLKASQSDGMIMTNQGILYFGLLSDNSIAKWDSHMPFKTNQKILSRDFTYIQWTNSFTMDLKGNIIVLTNTLQKFIYEKLDINQTNFWLLSGYVGQKSYLYSESSNGHHLLAKNGSTTDNTNTIRSIVDEFSAIKNDSSSTAGNHIVAGLKTVLGISFFMQLLVK